MCGGVWATHTHMREGEEDRGERETSLAESRPTCLSLSISFSSGRRRVNVARVITSPSFSPSLPLLLFSSSYPRSFASFSFCYSLAPSLYPSPSSFVLLLLSSPVDSLSLSLPLSLFWLSFFSFRGVFLRYAVFSPSSHRAYTSSFLSSRSLSHSLRRGEPLTRAFAHSYIFARACERVSWFL